MHPTLKYIYMLTTEIISEAMNSSFDQETDDKNIIEMLDKAIAYHLESKKFAERVEGAGLAE